MTCPTCRGLMVQQHTHDLVSREGRLWLGEWRWVWCCLRCEQVSEIETGVPTGEGMSRPAERLSEGLGLAA